MESRFIAKTPKATVTASTVAKAVMTLLRIDKFWNQLMSSPNAGHRGRSIKGRRWLRFFGATSDCFSLCRKSRQGAAFRSFVTKLHYSFRHVNHTKKVREPLNDQACDHRRRRSGCTRAFGAKPGFRRLQGYGSGNRHGH